MKDIVPFYVRLPAPLKEKLDAAAHERDTSLNKEIIGRLENSFCPTQETLRQYDAADLIAELVRRYPVGELFIQIGTPKAK